MIDPRNLPEMPALAIVGPCELHDEDLEVLGRQVIAHYGDTWVQIHRQVLDDLATLLGAAESPYLIPGSGTTCLDAAMLNLFEPGQKVLVADTGFFGQRLAQIATQQGLAVEVLPVEVGAPVEAGAVAERARGCDGVLAVHVETSTGVRHPIEQIAAAAREAGALCVIDGIASVGGEFAEVDAWGIDALVTSTQKGLETPPGLGIVALGPRGRKRVEARSSRPASWYLDLHTWDWYRREWASWHPHPVTMPTPLVLVLASSLRRILAHGFPAWVEARAALASRLRTGLSDLGFEHVAREGAGSNLVVAVHAEDAGEILAHVLRQGIQLSGGLPPLAGASLRIGLLGKAASEQMVDRVVDAIARARKET
ncbi:MAG TPA: aminotransferase class V-fold PLP-dependent enzyme [Actinomycetota bacterium]